MVYITSYNVSHGLSKIVTMDHPDYKVELIRDI